MRAFAPDLLVYSFAALGVKIHSNRYTSSPMPVKAKMTNATRISVASMPVYAERPAQTPAIHLPSRPR